MTGAMLGRQLSWTLATTRRAPSSSRRAHAATATKPPRADAASGGGGGDEAPKKPRKVVRRVAASDVAAGEGAGSPRAPVRRRAAASAASTSSAAPTDAPATRAKPAAKPKAKKRTVRRLKNNVAVAEATAERARLDETPDEPEVSEKRKVEETLAAAKFKKLAAKIAADAAGEELAAGVGGVDAASSPFSPPKAAPEAALVPRQLSVLEQVAETRNAVAVAERDGDGDGDGDGSAPAARVRGAKAAEKLKHVPADETPGERLKRLFREKRERGLARVRDKFENQQMFDELAGTSAKDSALGGYESEEERESLASKLEKGQELFGEAASANEQNKAVESGFLTGGGNGLSPNNSIDPFKLIPGEYVVHRKFGIGKFLGIRSIAVDAAPVNATTGETVGPAPKIGFLFIEYADAQAKIRPEKAAAQLYRFASPGALKSGVKPPKLSRIQDRKGWAAKEQNTKKHIRQLVVNQMCVYLQRLQCVREPYQPPSQEVYTRFGELFPFQLTPDQAMAVDDCYEDLTTRDTPMDRIVVGDVGFGKTEVAMRAIFRVFAGGGQVFVLAPTTVLAKQHAATIAARFRPFGAGVELMTRNVKESERKEVMARWKRGETQVIVGTHSLLNLEPEMYGRLKMLVIDEEQRFGVKHKDQISALKASVDVLTLSATPIPRTLHMAIAGFRDASLVTTPPPQRRPINTVLATYDATVVREAVQAELERDGQVFYVVPKIGMMEEANKRLKSLFPNLRVMQAHGQMKGEQLDSAMDEFASGHADVLLCTTIVESGLDIPNVNTIIIEEVQQFGLASLYQLRGRVGRAGRQAYAYMFHAEMADLREEAQERLLALEECCGLGEGFKLAERDMAIRGVGTIFGDKQSGEVDSIGADLYLELLYNQLEKIEKLRLNPVAPQDVRTPDWTSTPMLGGEYVATGDARVVANESLANARTSGEMEKVLESLTACFGEARDARTVTTINFHRMRVLAGELGVTRVTMDSDSGTVLFEVDADVEVREMLVDNLDDIYRKDLTVVDEGIRMVSLAGAGPEVTLAQAVNALRRVNEALPSFIKFL